MIGPFVPLLIGAHIALVASGGPPKINALATCRATEDTITKLFGDTTMATVEACMRQENDALAQIEKDWVTYPAADKTQCAQPKVYMPNYVEWLTCFEMLRDVRKMREEDRKASAAPPTSGRMRQPRP